MKRIFQHLILPFFAGLAGAGCFYLLQHQWQKNHLPQAQAMAQFQSVSQAGAQPAAAYQPLPATNPRIERPAMGESFADAAEKSRHAVVYIRTISQSYNATSWLDWWLGGGGSQRISSGSGVIYSSTGYIITNNHVIEDAVKIQVTWDKHVYDARLVGTDPSTDIAVLKIDANDLPAITIGSSEDVRVGDWVLAVGNPFNLTSTVTAGIVSAKGRELNILKSSFPIESFIQTDAAINPGNSGGALVDAEGKLVGINSAILSQTGSYAGYGFAIPIDIAQKVVDDIIKYGTVQKAFIGAEVVDLSQDLAKKLGTDRLNGVVVTYLQTDGAAEKEGVKKGDIITALDDKSVNSKSQFEQLLSYHSPGDKLSVKILRDGKSMVKNLTLTNKEGTTDIIRREAYYSKRLGAEFESVPKVERDLYKIKHGVRVSHITDGPFSRLGIDEGFIITAINGKAITTPKDLADRLTDMKGKVIIEGVNKQGVHGYYSFYF